MNIKFVLLTSLFLFSAPLAFASETGPSKPTAEGLGVCGICLEEILPTQLGTDALISGRELYGCDERHLFHRDCILDKHGRPKTPICPYCRATRDEPAAKTNEDALTAYHSGQFAAPWEGAPEQVRTQTPLQRAQADLVAMPAPAGVRPEVWQQVRSSVQHDVDRIIIESLEITSEELAAIINALPPIIKQSITFLSLTGTQLTSLPDAIGQLIGLKQLFLNTNYLTDLPDSIRHLTNLKILSLHNNKFASLPVVIEQLTGLITLKISFNDLTSLPEVFGRLTNLQLLIVDRGVTIPAHRSGITVEYVE